MKETIVRVVPRTGGEVLAAKIVRVTKTRVVVKTPDHLLHTVFRKNGEPCGGSGVFRVTEEDVHLLNDLESKSKLDQKKSLGRPDHWII